MKEGAGRLPSIPWSKPAVNDVDPHAWLADVLARLPDRLAKRVSEMTPWAWKASRNVAALIAAE